ncbi:phosphoglycolate phosphatase [Coralloluteibacterium thermophilus]|uniref:Phosphoglycolate phosphatase n=1 Tax=Coralloluteibacterium thermophilum TaxID=2707049 RepID=A0ABV9NJD7_9GAMM
MTRPYDAVLFDLDGTLLHSAPDIVNAMNASLTANGLDALPSDRLISFIGKGTPVLVARALEAQGRGGDPALAERVHAGYLAAYSERIGERGVLFEGARDCLATLAGRGIAIGIVTNKYRRFTETALAQHGIADYPSVIVAGDSLPERKPRPEPLLHACRALGATPARTLMVGDSVNDAEAARAAGCDVVCVTHGYNEGRPPETLGTPLIHDLAALPAWIDGRAADVATGD